MNDFRFDHEKMSETDQERYHREMSAFLKAEREKEAGKECDHCGRIRDAQALSGLCERCENEQNDAFDPLAGEHDPR